LEPQRTNQCPSSANYGTNIIQVTVSRNVTTAPNGLNEADRILDNNAQDEHLLGENFGSITNGQPYTVSCFFKADGTGGRAVIRYYGGEWVYAVYNLANGTVAFTDGNVITSIQNYGNGWYRCILTHTAVMDYTPMVTQLGIANSSNAFSYQGASNLGVYFWGYQAEQGSYVTSHIPTSGASVTRVGDYASKTGISSLIGSTAGTVFIDAIMNTGTTQNADVFLLKGSGASAFVMFMSSTTGNINLYLATSFAVPTIKSGDNRGLRLKIAISYQSGALVAYVNGVQTLSTGYTIEANLTDLYINTNDIGTANENTILSEFLLFKTALTNAQLAELTAL
jgi:hypothetical protein